ncbi:MAG TPA: hypothetical protein VK640_16820 [Actinomycetes bacterium]|nr:hypothetical protein [Actinomycetes bacterium]
MTRTAVVSSPSARPAHPRRLALVGVVGLTAAALVVGPALVAQAGGPGRWTTLSTGSMTSIDRADLARTPDGRLQVAYSYRTAAGEDQIGHLAVSATGATAVGSHPVGPALGSLVNDPQVVQGPGSELRLVYSGIGTGFAGELFSSVSLDGGAAFGAPGRIGTEKTAYASSGTSAVVAGGTLWSSWATTDTLYLHQGISDAVPDVSFDNPSTPGGSVCCAYFTTLARDAANESVWLAWYSNSSQQGTFVRQVSPALGAIAKVPGSTVQFGGATNSLAPDQAVALTGRSGAGGTYTAICKGYPTCGSVSVWKVGSSSTLAVPGSKDAKRIGVAAAPGGRLWVFWWASGTRTVKAVRTNAAVTKFGAVRSVRLPAVGTVWNTVGDAANGRLDLVVSFDPEASGGPRLLHTQVLPGLKVAASPRKWDNAGAKSVTFTVSDAGLPVKGAKVKVGSRSDTTDAKGKVTLTFPAGFDTGRKKAVATRTGYFRGVVTLRIT